MSYNILLLKDEPQRDRNMKLLGYFIVIVIVMLILLYYMFPSPVDMQPLNAAIEAQNKLNSDNT